MTKQLILDIKLSDDATFQNYVGPAARLVLGADGWTYIWGPIGSGRSHLLQSCCHYYQGSIYLSDLKRLSVSVLEGLEVMNVIAIDDVQDVLGDNRWEEALFHLMNAVKDRKNRLFVAGNARAASLSIRLPDLRSRLISANSIETCDLSDDEKIGVLMQRADNRGFRLGEDVGRFILSRSARNMHQLFELLHKLEMETLRQSKKVTIPFVKQILSL